MTTKGDEMSKDLLVLADEYAAATATFARALALKDEADSMSPIAREAGDKRAVLAEALAALDTVRPVRPVQVNAMLMEALERMVESVTGVDQVSAVDEARAALTAAKQAQPEPYGHHSPKTGKVYASTEAASMAMAGEVKTVYLAQPERAQVSDEQKRILFECVEQVKDGNELDYYLLGFEAAENAYGIKQGGQHD